MQSPRLHPDTIEEVKQQVDIVDIVSERVVLRKRGKDYLGLCPFHEEKTPSFSVSPSKQLYYCFGCQAGGNAFKFLMELGKQSFQEVVFELARRYQVPLKTLEPEQRQELQRQLSLRDQLYEVMALSASFYQHALRQPSGENARHYLKQRQLEAEIEVFGLGYAPSGWETLYRYLVEQKRYSSALVEQAGLVKARKSGGGFYDRFRDRIIIPIADAQGRIIGFGSRTLTGEEPKYLNSPDTPLFDKGKTLFALDRAKRSISKQDRAVVVEGYFDAIALHTAGITNAVASLGTALSQAQLKQLLRYTDSKQIVFNFDADRAGTVATQRAIAEIEPLIYSGQVQVRVLNLPGGKDADEFLRSSPQAAEQYRQQLDAAPLWLDWQLDQLLAERDLKQADQFQQAIIAMVKLLSKLDSNELRIYYIAECADRLSQGDAQYFKQLEDNLRLQVNKQRGTQQKPRQPASSPPRSERHGAGQPAASQEVRALPFSAERSRLEQAEALLLRLYLHCPETRRGIVESLEQKDLLFSLSHHRFLWQQILEVEAETRASQAVREGMEKADKTVMLLDELQRSLQFSESLAQVAHLFYLDEATQENLNRTPLLIQAAIAALEQVACEKHKRYCYERWQQLDPQTAPEDWQYYLQAYYQAKQKIIELESLRQFTRLDIVASE
ncbi:MAG: DNA primase [Cyanophyceae cyanobacterium]